MNWRAKLARRADGGIDEMFRAETEAIRLALSHIDRLEAGGTTLTPAPLGNAQLTLLTRLGNLLGRHSDLGRELVNVFELEWAHPSTSGGTAFSELDMVLRSRHAQLPEPTPEPTPEPVPVPVPDPQPDAAQQTAEESVVDQPTATPPVALATPAVVSTVLPDRTPPPPERGRGREVAVVIRSDS